MPDGAAIYTKAFRDGLRPDSDLCIWEWADENRQLPESKEKGIYRSSRTPYAREIMWALSPSSGILEVCAMMGTQVCKTTIGENFAMFVIDQAPGPILWVMPTGDMAKEHSKDRFQPAIDAMDCLKGKVKEARSRDSGNTITSKKFPGGFLKFAGADSPRSFRSKSIRYLVLDDVDGFKLSVGQEGDPCALARKRTDAFGRSKKIYENSTPTVRGLSRIERTFEKSDKRHYNVPCPFCHGRQKLQWGGKGAEFGLKFEHEGVEVKKVWYECKFCHEKISESHKTWMLEHGEWVPEAPEVKNRRGYHLSSLYSPLGWVSWEQIVTEFLEAGNDPELLKVWTNTRLAETWDDRGTQPAWLELKNRAEPYELFSVPRGGCFLTAGVDTQDDRFAVTIWAWGRGEESWLIFWGEIYGDPGLADTQEQLDSVLFRPFRHASGTELYVCSAAVDTGGHRTQDIYNYCRKRSPKVIAAKGASTANKPIVGRPTAQDVSWKGQTIKGGVQLWPIGSDTAKAQIYNRLALRQPGPGMIHFPMGLDDDFYIQLTSEKKVTRYEKGFPVSAWVLETGKRNEALDCTVLALAAAIRAGMPRANWDELEADLSPAASAEEATGAKGQDKPRVIKSKWMGQ